jgi:isochorismate synthase
MSLAGTLPNDGTRPTWSKKEKEEQAYVTNYISESFSKSNISCEIGTTETVKAGPVFHLKTELESTHNISFTDALSFGNNLHPTPAICGVPLEDAKTMIRNIENHDRAYYTGYLGFVNPEKELKLFVNLRCLQVLQNQLALYLGGGITAKSNAEKEWDETNFKAETLLSGLE